jgi:hypothetical protein
MGKIVALSAAERQRHRRTRAKLGELLVQITVDPAITAKLHAGRYLGLDELENKAAVAEAIVALLHDFDPKP